MIGIVWAVARQAIACCGKARRYALNTQDLQGLWVMVGENLDISSGRRPSRPAGKKGRGRRFVGIRFACCDVYTRVYVNRAETAYEGRCPRCFAEVSIRIGPEGGSCRFFTAY